MAGSGGSSSGSVDYPVYMKYMHAYVMGSSVDIGSGYSTACTKATYDIVELMNAAWAAASPFASYTAVDADTMFFPTGESITNFQPGVVYHLLEALYTYDADTDYTTYSTDAAVNSLTDATTDAMTDVYNERIVPEFATGYANINATMSSAYSLGLSIISATKTREVAKMDGHIRTDIVMRRLAMKQELKRLSAVLGAEVGRMYLAAKREEDDSNLDIAYRDAMFDMEVYKPFTQVMACASGANTPNHMAGVGKPSAIGAGLAGAATGAAIGSAIAPGMGTAIGAGVGGALGIASTM